MPKAPPVVLAPLNFNPVKWVALNDAFVRIRTALRAGDLAARDLHGHVTAGRLKSALRLVPRDGAETCGTLPPDFWERVGMSAAAGTANYVHMWPAKDDEVFEPADWNFFVLRADLDRLYPVARMVPTAPEAPAAPGT